MTIKRRLSIDEMTTSWSKLEKGFSSTKVQPYWWEKIDLSWWGGPEVLGFSAKTTLQNFQIENPDHIS